MEGDLHSVLCVGPMGGHFPPLWHRCSLWKQDQKEPRYLWGHQVEGLARWLETWKSNQKGRKPPEPWPLEQEPLPFGNPSSSRRPSHWPWPLSSPSPPGAHYLRATCHVWRVVRA